MSKNRRNHSPVFKSKVAMEALKERESLSELAEKYTLNAKQISQWKQELQKGSVELFKRKNSKSSKDQEASDVPKPWKVLNNEGSGVP